MASKVINASIEVCLLLRPTVAGPVDPELDAVLRRGLLSISHVNSCSAVGITSRYPHNIRVLFRGSIWCFTCVTQNVDEQFSVHNMCCRCYPA